VCSHDVSHNTRLAAGQAIHASSVTSLAVVMTAVIVYVKQYKEKRYLRFRNIFTLTWLKLTYQLQETAYSFCSLSFH
jgi:hypothetical protein